MVFTKANTLARKMRHQRLRGIKKEVGHKKPVYKPYTTSEKNFFFRVVVAGVLFFVSSSILPAFFVSEADFWLPEEASAESFKETIALTDEGFLIKPEIQTSRGNREGVGQVVDIIVESGDTVSSIAYRYGVSVATVVQNNDITNPDSLKPGQTLKILPVDGLLHTVKKNETVAGLAKEYKVEADKIIAQNNIDEEEGLIAGKAVIIPGVQKEVPVAIASSAGGVYKNAPAGSQATGTYNGTLFFPCEGRYTQGYRYGHYAVDIAQAGGSTIWAAESGTVIRAESGWNGGYGNVVVIDHGNGMTTLYAHMRDIYVRKGQKVSRKTPIGYMGNTGRVYGRTGIHLHFEVVINGVKKNPKAYF